MLFTGISSYGVLSGSLVLGSSPYRLRYNCPARIPFHVFLMIKKRTLKVPNGHFLCCYFILKIQCNSGKMYLDIRQLQMSDGTENFNNWPMTMLYSIYYEFSKRYPHGKSTAIKQDSTSAKTELVFRMLNFTLGEKTFIRGLQKFMNNK